MKNDKAESEMKVKEEQFLHGIGVSSEITIGTAHVIQSGLGQLPEYNICLLYTSPSPRDRTRSRMPSSA